MFIDGHDTTEEISTTEGEVPNVDGTTALTSKNVNRNLWILMFNIAMIFGIKY